MDEGQADHTAHLNIARSFYFRRPVKSFGCGNRSKSLIAGGKKNQRTRNKRQQRLRRRCRRGLLETASPAAVDFR